MTFLRLIILSLVTFRVTHMVTDESGPFWIFRKLRGTVKKKAPKETHMDDGISCQYCMSVWVATAVAISNHYLTDFIIYEIGLLALALSGAAVIINNLNKKT